MIDRIFGVIRKCELAVSSVIFMSALAVLTINIIMRYFLNTALTWAEEYMRYTIIWVTFMACALCAEDNLHVGVDVFIQMAPPWLRKVLNCFAMACATLFCGYMVEFSTRNTLMLFQTMQRSPVLQIPMGFVYLAMPIGILTTTLRFARMLVTYLRMNVSEFADKLAEPGADEIDMLKLD